MTLAFCVCRDHVARGEEVAEDVRKARSRGCRGRSVLVKHADYAHASLLFRIPVGHNTLLGLVVDFWEWVLPLLPQQARHILAARGEEMRLPSDFRRPYRWVPCCLGSSSVVTLGAGRALVPGNHISPGCNAAKVSHACRCAQVHLQVPQGLHDGGLESVCGVLCAAAAARRPAARRVGRDVAQTASGGVLRAAGRCETATEQAPCDVGNAADSGMLEATPCLAAADTLLSTSPIWLLGARFFSCLSAGFVAG